MSDRVPDEGIELTSIDKPSGGESKEDWAASIVGLVLLGLALAGLIPQAVIY